MEIQYYGANCVRLSDKKNTIVIDDNLALLGQKTVTASQDISVHTGLKTQEGGRFIIDGPGEYEIAEVSIRGVAARAHIDNNGTSATMYSIKMNNFNVAIVGHINASLSDEQLEAIGVIDVLLIPVGNYGYTLDADEAVSIIKKIEPKIVIPTHYADEAIKYEVPQADLQVFLGAVGVSEPELLDTLTLKEKEFGDKTKIVILKRSEIK